MSFFTKVSFVPRDSGVESVSFDLVDYGLIPFGNRNIENHLESNFKEYHFRIIDDYYTDTVTVLNWEEFKDFHKKNGNNNSSNDDINEFMNHYDEKVIYNWVIVEIYEWESGLD